jgi:AhpD family alkylhydroperoxidase
VTQPNAIFPSMTRPLNLRDIFLRIPDQALGLINFYENLMRGPSPLSAAERELIYAYGSRAAGCHFCHTSHSHCAIHLGISKDVFLFSPDQLERAPLRPGFGALLRYTTGLIVGGPIISRPRVEASGVERMNSEMLIDAILVAGLTAYINRVIEGLGAYSPDDQHARNGENLARFGYTRVRQEVAKSLSDAGLSSDSAWPSPVKPIPLELTSRGHLFRWLESYQRLVFDGPSGVPAVLRQQVRSADTATRTISPNGNRPGLAHNTALAFARRLMQAPIKSTESDIAALLAAGWSERDIIDLVITAATSAFAIRVETGFEECGLASVRATTQRGTANA